VSPSPRPSQLAPHIEPITCRTYSFRALGIPQIAVECPPSAVLLDSVLFPRGQPQTALSLIPYCGTEMTAMKAAIVKVRHPHGNPQRRCFPDFVVHF